jgi:hypothetical protein
MFTFQHQSPDRLSQFAESLANYHYSPLKRQARHDCRHDNIRPARASSKYTKSSARNGYVAEQVFAGANPRRSHVRVRSTVCPQQAKRDAVRNEGSNSNTAIMNPYLSWSRSVSRFSGTEGFRAGRGPRCDGSHRRPRKTLVITARVAVLAIFGNPPASLSVDPANNPCLDQGRFRVPTDQVEERATDRLRRRTRKQKSVRPEDPAYRAAPQFPAGAEANRRQCEDGRATRFQLLQMGCRTTSLPIAASCAREFLLGRHRLSTQCGK